MGVRVYGVEVGFFYVVVYGSSGGSILWVLGLEILVGLDAEA